MEDNYRKKMMLGQDGNALVQLIVINAVFFAIFQFINVVYILGPKTDDYFTRILNWFVLPASLDKLSLRPWTLLTYMFADKDIIQFISNMLWLWGFGYILQDMTGNRKLVPVYLYGGLAGAAFYMLTFSMLPFLRPHIQIATLMGANASVVAVAVATTTVAPDYRLFPMINGGIPLWILTVIFLLVDFSGIPRGDVAAYAANLAGAGAGFFFIYMLRRGHDGSIWMNHFFGWCNDLYNPNKKKKARSPKDEFYYKVSGTQPFKKIPNVTQQRIDEILDKINHQGYRFLTDEEKEILKRAADEEEL